MSVLNNFALGEPIATMIDKLNALVADSNAKTTSLGTLTESLEYIYDEVVNKLESKPFFFPTQATMIACTYLEDGNSCFVIGEQSVTNGKMKLFYISNDNTLVADGVSIIQLTGVALKAIWITDETDTGLLALINENAEAILDLSEAITAASNSLDPTKLTGAVAIGKGGTGATTASGARANLDLKAGVVLSEINTPTAATWASTATLNGATVHYYDLTVSGFTSNQRFILQFDESKYSDEDTLKLAKKLVNGLIAVDGMSGKIRLYSNTSLEADGTPIYFLLYKLF